MQLKKILPAGLPLFAVVIICLAATSSRGLSSRNHTAPSLFAADTNGVEPAPGSHLGFKMWASSPFFYNQPDSPIYLYLEAKAIKYAPTGKQRTPLNIALVLDRSGSMIGDKLTYCKKAAQFVVDNLDAEDRISIVVYDSEVGVLVANTKAGNKQSIKALIESIRERGSTFMSGGMLSGYAEVKRFFEAQKVNRVLLLTDGLANQGITDRKSLNIIANKWATTEKISLSTFGVGADFDEKMLTDLAEYGIGNYYFIDKAENIPPIFNKELKGLLEVVAQNTTIRVELPDAVELVKLYGYASSSKGNTVEIPFRDVFSEEQKSILLELKLKKPVAEALTFRSVFGYDDAISGEKMQQINSSVTLQPTSDYTLVDNNADDYVEQQVAVFRSNDLLERAMDEVDKGNYSVADSLATYNASYLTAKKGKIKRLTKTFAIQDSLNANYKLRLAEAKRMSESERKMYQKATRNTNYMYRKKKG